MAPKTPRSLALSRYNVKVHACRSRTSVTRSARYIPSAVAPQTLPLPTSIIASTLAFLSDAIRRRDLKLISRQQNTYQRTQATTKTVVYVVIPSARQGATSPCISPSFRRQENAPTHMRQGFRVDKRWGSGQPDNNARAGVERLLYIYIYIYLQSSWFVA